jgi:hypothetical protein
LSLAFNIGKHLTRNNAARDWAGAYWEYKESFIGSTAM